MRIIIEDESCDIIENATLLMARIEEDYTASHVRSALPSNKLVKQQKSSNNQATKLTNKSVIVSRQIYKKKVANDKKSNVGGAAKSSIIATGDAPSKTSNQLIVPNRNNFIHHTGDSARATCDEVIRDAIEWCREADYKMELAKLLSAEAKIELYIEHGKLSDAQRLACTMNRPDIVSSIIEEASRLNQNHIKTLCQLWLAKKD